MDFLYFFTNYKQDHRVKTAINFDSIFRPTFEKIIDFSMHNVYWDTLYCIYCIFISIVFLIKLSEGLSAPLVCSLLFNLTLVFFLIYELHFVIFVSLLLMFK